MKIPKVSVIIPIYNAEQYLERCLNAVIKQTLKEIEIILIDDGSSDHSYQICRKFKKQDNRIRLYQQENRGAGASRNLGLKYANGEYLSFLDADDFFEPDMLEKMYLEAKRTKADIVVCDFWEYNEETHDDTWVSWSVRRNLLPSVNPFASTNCQDVIFQIFSSSLWNKLFRRELIKLSNICFPTSYRQQDNYFVYAALALGKRIFFLDQKLLHYCPKKSGLNNKANKYWKCTFDVYFQLQSFLVKQGIFHKLSKSLVNRFLNEYVGYVYGRTAEPIKTFSASYFLNPTAPFYYQYYENWSEKFKNFLHNLKRKRNFSSTLYKLYQKDREKIIPIIYNATESADAPIFTAISIQSIIENCKSSSFFDIYIICDNKLGQETQYRLESLSNEKLRVTCIAANASFRKNEYSFLENILCGYSHFFYFKPNTIFKKDIFNCLVTFDKTNLKEDLLLYSLDESRTDLTESVLLEKDVEFLDLWWEYAKKSPFYEQILFQKKDREIFKHSSSPIHSPTESVNSHSSQENFYKEYSDWLLDLKCNTSLFVPFTKKPFKRKKTDVKIFAHYLPQFHAIPENDKNYGKGFTEWRNVASAIPLFVGHYQPKIPYDLGFYTLDNIEVIQRQVEIAKAYGIYGFCFYWYWFSGKKLLEKPLYQFLKSDIDFHFHLCWCNESWSKLWDNGDEKTIIMKQELKKDDADKFFMDILPFLQDHRYEKIDNKPILIIYRPFYFGEEKMASFINRLNELAIQDGFNGFYFLGATNTNNDHSKLPDMGFSAGVEWPPVFGDERLDYSPFLMKPQKIIEKCSVGVVNFHKFIMERRYLYPTTYPLFKCVFPSWDNSPRKVFQRKGFIFLLSDEDYAKWLRDALNYTKEHHSSQEQYMYVFSWNEWAEGAALEPTTRFGYKYLDILKNVLENCEKG